MADRLIANLPAVSTVNNTDIMILENNATTQKMTVTQLKAAVLTSPALTGTPTVPTATAGTNTTQAASTAFVYSSLAAKVPRQMRGGYAAAIVGAGAWTSVPVVFSNAFTTACDGVVATPYATSGDYRFNILIGSMSKTGCTVKIYNNEAAAFTGGVTVIAFGY